MNEQPVNIPSSADIARAAERIRDVVRRTPVIRVAAGELDVPVPVTLKLEFLQHTGSFKVRGAANTLALLRVAERGAPTAGVCCASGGNHGAAVAWAARAANLPATVFVPDFSPKAKTDIIESLGARLRRVEGFYADALAASRDHARREGAFHVDAYDAPQTVAGQGTLGLELAEQVPEGQPVLVGCGGGGLYAGVALALDGRNRVIAAEPSSAPSLTAALEAGEPVDVEVGGIALDSLGARRAGRIATAVGLSLGTKTLTVADENIATAQALLHQRLRIVAEPGGATALAALLAHPEDFPDGATVVVSGANATPPSSTGR
ncbi:threonine dehydratase [Saccharothrix coeruleofusca]|uniref:serine/threonine dehydratase n=1 Tax=Saccharothrix coeruleofusca TaxID=33919 RepID=UPI001FD4F8F1|nr:serine/threonine dehydratase [Saccharothrix coeruleofusca]MBP2336383.1 threonine dehydratase [Saccharothrix coeruleofusca]